MDKHPDLKVGDYVTWDHGGRAQCASVTWIGNETVCVLVGEGIFELLYKDEIDTIAPDLSGNTLDWSK